MGNIRHSNIKTITFKLLNTYGDAFTEDFDQNKALVTNTQPLKVKPSATKLPDTSQEKSDVHPNTNLGFLFFFNF